MTLAWGERRSLPGRRSRSTGYKVRIGGQVFFLHTGEHEDGSLGEVFLDASKLGSFQNSMLDAFAIAISIGLQYGVPLEEFVEVFVGTKFFPDGVVEGDPDIRFADSVTDWIFKRLALDYPTTKT